MSGRERPRSPERAGAETRGAARAGRGASARISSFDFPTYRVHSTMVVGTLKLFAKKEDSAEARTHPSSSTPQAICTIVPLDITNLYLGPAPIRCKERPRCLSTFLV